jgi:hypothetical protein
LNKKSRAPELSGAQRKPRKRQHTEKDSTMKSTLLRLPTFRHTSFETCLSCDRSDGKRIEYVLVHPLNISGEGAQEPYLHLSTRKIHKHAANGFNQEIALSMEEARRLRDFLNRPEMAEWLEEAEQGE